MGLITLGFSRRLWPNAKPDYAARIEGWHYFHFEGCWEKFGDDTLTEYPRLYRSIRAACRRARKDNAQLALWYAPDWYSDQYSLVGYEHWQ